MTQLQDVFSQQGNFSIVNLKYFITKNKKEVFVNSDTNVLMTNGGRTITSKEYNKMFTATNYNNINLQASIHEMQTPSVKGPVNNRPYSYLVTFAGVNTSLDAQKIEDNNDTLEQPVSESTLIELEEGTIDLSNASAAVANYIETYIYDYANIDSNSITVIQAIIDQETFSDDDKIGALNTTLNLCK
jgi:hypothetical protein